MIHFIQYSRVSIIETRSGNRNLSLDNFISILEQHEKDLHEFRETKFGHKSLNNRESTVLCNSMKLDGRQIRRTILSTIKGVKTAKRFVT